jgi:hypothetical protein
MKCNAGTVKMGLWSAYVELFEGSLNPINTGLPNGFSTFFYSTVQNSGNKILTGMREWHILLLIC